MEQLGRRERKKAQTRQALADAALELFAARGYDQVSVKEVADAADVSVTTLFKYFPTKEALVFDLDEDVEAALVASVRDRAGKSVPQALREHLWQRMCERPTDPEISAFAQVVAQTPVLGEYADRMWRRHETALAHAIAAEVGAPEDDIRCAALARFALEAGQLAHRHGDNPDLLVPIFDLLENGWPY
ncbi:TetR/AcrR family transcriptional regulator [Kutzneria sp. CA-103260]|uniref:TetR/AcrR family transcriptional regulator n=1 Tax=Kutzneria sp. CA-103260 TaxID=2802641 RepID=UPI001BAB4B58|nr:TetR/AcrR family transcriptional regulator [Kutzneria sp. CA-103260]